MKALALTAAILASLFLSACEPKQGQQTYKAGEVGVSRAVEFGAVLNVREVAIAADPSGAGALGGGAVGAGAGSYVGGGSGNAWATAGGAVLGAVIGHAIEQEMRNSTGYEYTLSMLDGTVKTIVQEKIEGDQVFAPGDKVMLQYCDTNDHNKKCYASANGFQRLLPVAQFPPEYEQKKKKVKKAKAKPKKEVEEHDEPEPKPQQ